MLGGDNMKAVTLFGSPPASVAVRAPSTLFAAERRSPLCATGIKFTRWMRNSVPPPSYVKAAGFQGRVDRWQEFEWVAPSSVLQWTGAADVGTGAEEGHHGGNGREGGFQFRLFHGLTPETET